MRRVRDRELGPARCRACGRPIVRALADNGRVMDIDAQAMFPGAGGGWVLWFDEPGDDGDQCVSQLALYEARTGQRHTGRLWTAHRAVCPARIEAEASAPQLPIWGVINGGRR